MSVTEGRTNEETHRPRRHRRPRGHPRGHQHRRDEVDPRGARTTPTPSSPGTTRRAQRPALNKLYEKAKTSQWNGETDLPWDTEVDQEAVVIGQRRDRTGGLIDAGIDLTGTPFEKWGDKEWLELGVESQNWTLSQFMHGEQGALDLHRQDRRDGAVDRRQVLRGDPGDGRGPPRRGVRQVPRHEAHRATTRSTPT